MEEEKTISFEELLEKYKPNIHSIWKNKWKIFWLNFAIALLVAGYLLLFTKNYYSSTVTILPDYGSKSSSMGALGGLAAMAGVSVGKAEPTEIYSELIKSETVLSDVIYKKYKTEEFADSVNLIQYFEIEADESKSKEANKRNMFFQVYEGLKLTRITTEVDKMTKVLNISATMPEPKLSADVVNAVAKALDHYVKNKRKSNASNEMFYIEKRIVQVKDTLILLEDKIEKFSEQNRSVMQSPKLSIEFARLKREVEIRNVVYIELQKQIELTKIEQIKDIPIVNVKEYAETPVMKAGPKRSNSLIICMFLSFSFSFVYFFFNQTIKNLINMFKTKLK